MAFTWSYDTPSGTYKNNKLSENLRSAAIADTKFLPFVHTEEGYGKKMGESITITRVSNLSEPVNGRLSEQQRIPEDDLVLSTIPITVAEWGRAVPYTSLSEDLGKFDPDNIVQKELMKQMRLTMDTAASAPFKSSSAKIKATPTGVASLNISTGGVAGAVATANLNQYHVEQIRDYMKGTLFIPPYEGDDYVCLASTKACRGIKQDPAWETWHKYTDPAAKYNAEIGRIENVRFVEVNHASALSGVLGSGGVLGEAVFFGEDAVAMAVAEDPHLRRALPQDYGRSKGVAWYGILEFGIIWDTANPGEARIVHLTSL